MVDAEKRSLVWTGIAFSIALGTVVSAISVLGVKHGIPLGLMATGRIAFVYFFLAYAGGPLTTLFGSAFLPVRQRARDFGFSFAAVILVHLGLIAYLCAIGDAPGVGVFVVFGPAAVFTGLLTLLSSSRARRRLPENSWPPIRTVATTYILYAFLRDFVGFPPSRSLLHLILYGPFATLAIMSFVLRLAAWAKTSGAATFATARLRTDPLKGRRH